MSDAGTAPKCRLSSLAAALSPSTHQPGEPSGSVGVVQPLGDEGVRAPGMHEHDRIAGTQP